DAAAEPRRVELRDRARAAAASRHALPEALAPDAERRDDADARDDDARCARVAHASGPTICEMGAFVWLGGGMFVGALAFCAYSYGVTWSCAAAFTPAAAAVDALLFSVFALHHSLFAREPVKQWVSSAVPEPMLRSVYVWIASLLLIAACAAWQPVGGELYDHAGVLAIAHGVAQLAGVLIIVQA